MTVGLIAGGQRERAEESLRHILAQTALARLEIVVVDLNPSEESFAGSEHPKVRYVQKPHLHYFCAAQIELVRQARAPIIAFIEDHSYAEPQWAEEVLKAFANARVAAVNYTFTTPPGRATLLHRSILLAEYGPWMAPHPGGRIRTSASTNIAYSRKVLLDAIANDEGIFEAEFLIHRRILKSGYEIHLAPRATVAHQSWLTLKDACNANCSHRRVFASRRALVGNWGRGRRIAWAVAMASMPMFQILRLAMSLRRRPALWGTFLIALPTLLIIYGGSSTQEAAGYLFGAGNSRDEFVLRELSVPRNG